MSPVLRKTFPGFKTAHVNNVRPALRARAHRGKMFADCPEELSPPQSPDRPWNSISCDHVAVA